MADDAHAACEHYRLVVAPELARDLPFVGAEEPAELRTPELVAERRAADGSVDHYLEGSCKARREVGERALPRLLVAGDAEVGDHEAAKPRDGARALASRGLVANLATDACRRAWERGNGRRVVVRLDLHELVDAVFAERVGVVRRVYREDVCREALHHGGVVLVCRESAAGALRMGVLDHLEEGLRLLLPVDYELRAEDLVAAMLGVHLAEHRKLGVGRVAPGLGKRLGKVFHLLFAYRKPHLAVRLAYGLDALRKDVIDAAGLRLALGEYVGDVAIDALRHPVVQGRERRDGNARLDHEANSSLDALDRLKPAVAEYVGRLRAPRGYSPLPREDEEASVASRGSVDFGTCGERSAKKRRRALQLDHVGRRALDVNGVNPLGLDPDAAGAGGKFRDHVPQRVHPERRICI